MINMPRLKQNPRTKCKTILSKCPICKRKIYSISPFEGYWNSEKSVAQIWAIHEVEYYCGSRITYFGMDDNYEYEVTMDCPLRGKSLAKKIMHIKELQDAVGNDLFEGKLVSAVSKTIRSENNPFVQHPVIQNFEGKATHTDFTGWNIVGSDLVLSFYLKYIITYHKHTVEQEKYLNVRIPIAMLETLHPFKKSVYDAWIQDLMKLHTPPGGVWS